MFFICKNYRSVYKVDSIHFSIKRGFKKVLNKKILTNNQLIILGVVIFLLIIFIIAVNYSSSVRDIFVGGELKTLSTNEGEFVNIEPVYIEDRYNCKDRSEEECKKISGCKWDPDRCGYESGCITFGFWQCIQTEGCSWTLFHGGCYADNSCTLNTPPTCATSSNSVCGLVLGEGCIPRMTSPYP